MGQTVFIGMKTFQPGMNELRLTPVGNYGVQASWKDGYDTASTHGRCYDSYSSSGSSEPRPLQRSISKQGRW
ncbi:MAG: hypothetical protein IPM83_15630 [Ignavibacteria bacterium]|nr:hypothetical protein [Ignavibacteria bacterium]